VNDLAPLRDLLDHHVVGHDEVKTALLLRFALQLRVSGLIQSGVDDAKTLIDRFAAGSVVEQPDPAPVTDRATLDALNQRMYEVEVGAAVRAALLDILRTLVLEFECNETNSLLTDRTFLVKAIKILRGAALLAGRSAVDLPDLAALSWMTTFRVPPEAHEALPRIIGRVSRQVRAV